MGFADALQALKPEILLLLGDRFEIFAAAAAALVAGIPIAHVHGGELTEGAFDDAFRHSITKMAQLHFVATEDYRRRVIQLGEQPDRVFVVGGLGSTPWLGSQLLDRAELEQALDFTLGASNLLVTFHPATLEAAASEQQLAELLAALDRRPDTHLIFTLPNADTNGRAMCDMIKRYVAGRSSARAYVSLGSCATCRASAMSMPSWAIHPAVCSRRPGFRIGTVNIGDRQRGRLRGRRV